MLLRDPSYKILARWIKEANVHRAGFGDMMIPRGKVEIPNYTHVATTLADIAEKNYREKGSITFEEIGALVREAWMGSLRLLELAALEGIKGTDGDILMQDPALGTKNPSEIAALAEISDLFAKFMLARKTIDKK